LQTLVINVLISLRFSCVGLYDDVGITMIMCCTSVLVGLVLMIILSLLAVCCVPLLFGADNRCTLSFTIP